MMMAHSWPWKTSIMVIGVLKTTRLSSLYGNQSTDMPTSNLLKILTLTELVCVLSALIQGGDSWKLGLSWCEMVPKNHLVSTPMVTNQKHRRWNRNSLKTMKNRSLRHQFHYTNQKNNKLLYRLYSILGELAKMLIRVKRAIIGTHGDSLLTDISQPCEMNIMAFGLYQKITTARLEYILTGEVSMARQSLKWLNPAISNASIGAGTSWRTGEFNNPLYKVKVQLMRQSNI